MKALTEKKGGIVRNAWGGNVYQYEQAFEVEESDVGKVQRHYLGFNNRDVKITDKDVGKTIIIFTDNSPSWTCWCWKLADNPRKGDEVKLKPKFMDDGDEKYRWVAVSDVEKGRLDITPEGTGLAIPPINTVRLDMLEGY